MRRTLLTACIWLFTFFLSSCLPGIPQNPASADTQPTILFVYRFDVPAFVGFSSDFQVTREIPFTIPPNCGLFSIFPAPVGQILLIELNCPNGQTVLFLDTETDFVSQPVTSSDAHFLAWTGDGKSAYLKVDSLGNTQIVRASVNGSKDDLPIPEFTYDLSSKPDSRDFTFTLSRGLGYGSELYLAQNDGINSQLLYADQYNYISYARFSLDGKQIAFIKTPDTQTPFTVGELWVMDSDGENARTLADADAGHGYAANWSPDGAKIAFVARENPDDENADQSSEALISNIYVVDVKTGTLTQVTYLTEGWAETPHWSPQGNILGFNVVLNGRMQVQIADMESGEILPFETDIAPVGGSTCCPAWMRK
ncbi:MAG TPA: hypothetical protein VIS72_15940 [Anaerolineales bacterium]